MKTKLLAMTLLAGSALFAETHFSIGVGVGGYGNGYYAPPPPVVRYAPPYPGPGYTWVEGYWGPRHRWQRGYWDRTYYRRGFDRDRDRDRYEEYRHDDYRNDDRNRSFEQGNNRFDNRNGRR